MTTAPTSGARRPRMTTMPSSSLYMCRARLLCRRALSRASAIWSTRRQPRTMRSTCSAVPALPTLSRRSSVSGVATRVRARTFAYDSSPRARAWARGGTGVEPDAPRQPRGARAEAGVPAGASVEFADEVKELRGGGVEVSRQLGDLIAESIEICHALVSRVNLGGRDHER